MNERRRGDQPASPAVLSEREGGDYSRTVNVRYSGLSKRERFVLDAMSALLSNPNVTAQCRMHSDGDIDLAAIAGMAQSAAEHGMHAAGINP